MSYIVKIHRIGDLVDYKLVWSSFLLRTLIVYSGKPVVGILPLTVLSEQTRVGSVRVLTCPLHDWGSFYGPIGLNPTATLQIAIHYLTGCRHDWELFDLRWVDTERFDHDRTQRTMQVAGFSGIARRWNHVGLVDTRTTWNGYLQSRSARLGSNVRRLLRRAEAAGIKYVRYRPRGSACGDDDPRWDLYADCCELAQRSWQGSSETGTTLSHTKVRDFFREPAP